jgi:hypothetical protein
MYSALDQKSKSKSKLVEKKGEDPFEPSRYFVQLFYKCQARKKLQIPTSKDAPIARQLVLI